ncbi:(2Fe-2S)-binding protein [Roseomonas sp. WA12]
MPIRLTINGVRTEVDVEAETPALWVLRDIIGLTGTKFGCGIAMCGACTIHVDGEARRSCVTPISELSETEVWTVEGLATNPIGEALQKAWIELDVPQCGYCQSGQLMSAAALLHANPDPSDEEIELVMAGNICRCGTYGRIRAGIRQVAVSLKRGRG